MPGGQVPRGIREQSGGAYHRLLEVGDRSVQLLVDDHVKQRGPPGLERSPQRGNDVRRILDPPAVGAEIASEAGSNASRPLSNSRFVRVLTSDRPAKASWVDDLTDEQLVSTNPVQHAQWAHRPVPDSGFVGAVPEGPAQRGHALDTVHQTVDVIGAHAVQVPHAIERVERVDPEGDRCQVRSVLAGDRRQSQHATHVVAGNSRTSLSTTIALLGLPKSCADPGVAHYHANLFVDRILRLVHDVVGPIRRDVHMLRPGVRGDPDPDSVRSATNLGETKIAAWFA